MILRGYRIQRFALTLRRPLKTATAEYRLREGLVLTVRTDDQSGVGECTPLVEFGAEDVESSARALTAMCEWAMRREVPEDASALDEWLDGHLGAFGSAAERHAGGVRVASVMDGAPAGGDEQAQAATARDATSGAPRQVGFIPPAARHALECALLELIARRQRIPLRALLHSQSRDVVQVNALLTSVEPEALAAEGLAAVVTGFRTLKVKVATAEVEQDVRRLTALRAAVGDDVRIRIDANGGWFVANAAQNLLAFESMRLELCEQPVPAHEGDALGSLSRGGSSCLIAADEAVSSMSAGRALLNAVSAPDVLVIRPMVLGGLVRSVRLGWEAQVRGVKAYVASSLEGAVARGAAAHVAAALPEHGLASGLATGSLFLEDSDGAFAPREGWIALGVSPGLGLGLGLDAAGWR